MIFETISAGHLLSFQVYLRKSGGILIRARPFREPEFGADCFQMMYIKGRG